MPRKKRTTKTRKTLKVTPRKTKGEAIVAANSSAIYSQESILHNSVLSWVTPEFVYHEKPGWWHLVVYSFVGSLVILMVFLREWFAVVVFILLGFLIYRYAEVKPKDIEVGITELGIKMGDKFYPFNQLRSFWIVFEPPVKTLNLELTKRFSPILSIQFTDIDPIAIKEALREHVLEDTERTEDFIDKFTRLIRF